MTSRSVEFQTSGSQIAIRVDHQHARFTVPAGDVVPVENERHVLVSEKPFKWIHGNHLREATVSGIALPDCVASSSIVVKLPDGSVAEPGKDYQMDDRWAALGRLDGGRISTDTEVLISYGVGQMRVDSIVTREGKLEYIKGPSRKSAPRLPEVTTGAEEVVRIFVPYRATSVEPDQVYVVGPAFPEPDAAEMARRAKRVERTLSKLRKGESVTIVTWGDSVTEGIDASPGKAFPQLFVARLRERFPKATIKHVNAAIGGSNTVGRLPAIDKEVLAHKPDLVTIEFVNDMGLPPEVVRKNHEAAIAAIAKAGGEAIIITPHFTMRDMMAESGIQDVPRGSETRPNVELLRQIANEQSVGLADVSRRWEHLESEGIPYMAYLENGINHPDDRGHELFVKELLTLFPAE